VLLQDRNLRIGQMAGKLTDTLLPPPSPSPAPCTRPRLRVGLAAITVLCFVWVIAGEAIQWVSKPFPYPFTIRVLIQSTSSVLVPASAMLECSRGAAAGRSARTSLCALVGSGRKLLPYAPFFSALLLLQDGSWVWSLQHTTVGINTAIYQTYIAYVFVLSVLILGERVTTLKSLSTLVCLAGLVPVALNDGASKAQEKENTWPGVAATIASAMMYAVFQVAYVKLVSGLIVKEEKHVSAFALRMLWIGLLGLMTIPMAPIFAILCNYMELQVLELPSLETVARISVISLDMSIYQIALCVALGCVSPLLVAGGALMSIPLGYLVDFLVRSESPTSDCFMGSLVIVIGFLGMLFSDVHHPIKSDVAS